MAELIKKSELEKSMTEDWLLENIAAQDSKSSIRKDIENVIDNLTTTTEAELRANVIDEFAEKIRDWKKEIYTNERYAGELDFLFKHIDEIALQMKGKKA